MPAPTKFSDFSSLQSYLDSRGFFHWDLTLDRIRRVLAKFELFGGSVSRPRIVHVVGTNGKGSTSTFLAAMARAQGLRVGLYTSPHFVSIRERALINGEILSEREWVACANLVLAAGGADLTYFEFISALSLAAFARAGAELIVLEAGLGGRNDATTAAPADMVIFAPISLDHENVLGAGIEAIAADKADAMAVGRGIRATITATQEPAVADILRGAAKRLAAPLFSPAELVAYPEGTALGLAGPHQWGNAHLALAAWQWLADNFGFKNTEEGRLTGLREAFIPGRLQLTPAAPVEGLPALILDGAHNAHGLQVLAAALGMLKLKPGAIIFSALMDKDMAIAADVLPQLTSGSIFIPPIKSNPRAAAPEALAGLFGARGRVAPDFAGALRLAAKESSGAVLICGSLYLLGEFYTLYPRYLRA